MKITRFDELLRILTDIDRPSLKLVGPCNVCVIIVWLVKALQQRLGEPSSFVERESEEVF